MSRYVDIEGDWVDDVVKAYSLGYYEDDEYAIPIERFDSAPSIDLVRCGECKYHTSDDECTNPHWDSSQDLYPMAMEYDFCSYGEREGE